MEFDLNREPHFSQFIEQELEPFWQKNAQPGQFQNAQGLDIHYVVIEKQEAKGTIVISPGRVEGYLKYKELAFDLSNAGYQVYIIDHQGQGLSSRRLRNVHKGYVGSFDDYVDDLYHFVTNFVMPKSILKPHLICHSMGGAIGLRLIQKHPDIFASASFSSPMWGFISGRFPQRLARHIVKLGKFSTGLFGRDSGYFFGAKDYSSKPFVDNELTSSEVRYAYFRQLYDAMPQMQLGGITFSWLQAAIEALDLAYLQLHQIRTPIWVLQAENDTVVDNLAQNKFCQRLHELMPSLCEPQPSVIAGAKHEIFIESDQRRQVALQQILKFITHCS